MFFRVAWKAGSDPAKAIHCANWALILVLLFTAACTSEEPLRSVRLQQQLLSDEVYAPLQTTHVCWRLGFDRRLEPKEDVRQVASLARWLEQATGLPWCIQITLPGEALIDQLCNGEVDFAVMGMVSYLQAHHRCGAQIIVRGLNSAGEDVYRAAIVVPVHSSITTLADLRGRSFAFGAPNSTQGHLIPRLMLQEAGLTLNDFRIFTFNESHAATAKAVTSGRFDAGALQDTLAIKLAERKLVRILAFSEPYPSSGIVAAPDVPTQTIMLTQEALVRLDPQDADAQALYHWERSEMPHGFVKAHDADYQPLRELAAAIGLLEP
jgi:phosphonate transport system substrate-binding protein